jgi:ubiquinone/menaquinone biosynthesis C-methylase UbiE
LRFLAAFLRIFFKLLYHTLAWTYDWVAAIVSLGMWKTWVMIVIPYLSGPCVLELGHGPGHLQATLLKSGKKVFGLDESRQMGRMARKRLLHQGLSPSLVRGHAQEIPFPDNTFDHIVATFPSEYIADPRTLAEIYRVLTPGGEAVVLPIAWITGRRWYERAAAWLFRITGQVPAWDERLFTPEPVRRIGFQTRVERIALNSSTLLIALAQKPRF